MTHRSLSCPLGLRGDSPCKSGEAGVTAGQNIQIRNVHDIPVGVGAPISHANNIRALRMKGKGKFLSFVAFQKKMASAPWVLLAIANALAVCSPEKQR